MSALSQDRAGAAALEFALVAPVFLVLVLGGVETSRWAWGAAATRDLAARAARCIAVTPGLCKSAAATHAQLAAATPLVGNAVSLRAETAACGIRVVAMGGFPARLTPGLGRVAASACVR
jgi:Flp pilus assembly protein TadG